MYKHVQYIICVRIPCLIFALVTVSRPACASTIFIKPWNIQADRQPKIDGPPQLCSEISFLRYPPPPHVGRSLLSPPPAVWTEPPPPAPSLPISYAGKWRSLAPSTLYFALLSFRIDLSLSLSLSRPLHHPFRVWPRFWDSTTSRMCISCRKQLNILYICTRADKPICLYNLYLLNSTDKYCT
jgi:hypothetical protein